MSDDELPTFEAYATAAAPPAKPKWDRRPVVVGIILLLIGVAAIFWPIALLVRTLYAVFGEAGSSNQAGDMALVVLAIPSGSIIGIGCLVVGSTMLVRARRMSRVS
jgi:uncharacterized membrane protein HdeD (DUF308 family)